MQQAFLASTITTVYKYIFYILVTIICFSLWHVLHSTSWVLWLVIKTKSYNGRFYVDVFIQCGENRVEILLMSDPVVSMLSSTAHTYHQQCAHDVAIWTSNVSDACFFRELTFAEVLHWNFCNNFHHMLLLETFKQWHVVKITVIGFKFKPVTVSNLRIS